LVLLIVIVVQSNKSTMLTITRNEHYRQREKRVIMDINEDELGGIHEKFEIAAKRKQSQSKQVG
jgi:hypothetical protein